MPLSRNKYSMTFPLFLSAFFVSPLIFSLLSAFHCCFLVVTYMGASFSGLEADGKNRNTACCASSKPGFEGLPENCIALILSCFEPPEICALASLNRTFRWASCSDALWESKLPENFRILAKKLIGDGNCVGSLTNKEIFTRLCHPIRFSRGTKEVWLDKKGRVCVAISWKGLKITGIDDRRYWTHFSTHQSRFDTIAYLQQIWWLQVEGDVEFEFPRGKYGLFFRLQLGRPSQAVCPVRRRSGGDAEKIHGWNKKPVEFQLSSSDGQNSISKCFLEEQGTWINYHVGDFVVGCCSAPAPTKIKFSMTQIDCTHTKGGLCLDSVFILPK